MRSRIIMLNKNIKNKINEKINNVIIAANDEAYIVSLMNEVVNYLSSEIEELNVSSYIFREAIKKSIYKLLENLDISNVPVLISADTIPGFTSIVYKKKVKENEFVSHNLKEKLKEIEEKKPITSAQEEITFSIIRRYLETNNKKIFVVDSEKIHLVLFPVEDTKKNLKELDLYII